MASTGFGVVAACLLLPGVLLLARNEISGQDTIGGVLTMFGVLFGLFAGICWRLGL